MGEEERDDELWLDALAGRAGAPRDTAASREAGSLRAAILARETTPVALLPAQDPAREEQLIARARQAGLIPGARRAGSRPLWLLAAAAFAGVAVTVGLWLQPAREPEVVRGDPQGVVARIVAPDPRAAQRALLGELRALGIEATGYEVLERQGIDADLPLPIPADVRAVLDRHHIPPPADGVLRVEIVPGTTE
jgi:hypothetical protein